VSRGEYIPSIDYQCPDCKVVLVPAVYSEGTITYRSCGLSAKDHKWMRKVRQVAELNAKQELVRERTTQALPRALIKEVYDDAERRAHGRT
jgi:hypothetical protein